MISMLKNKLKILISGIKSITTFSFQSKYNLHYKTYITQEMLKKNYLASNLIFISTLHNKKIIDLYIKKLDPIFKKISFFEKNKLDVSSYIKNGVCHNTFQRLND